MAGPGCLDWVRESAATSALWVTQESLSAASHNETLLIWCLHPFILSKFDYTLWSMELVCQGWNDKSKLYVLTEIQVPGRSYYEARSCRLVLENVRFRTAAEED